ncbi:MAG TPA: sensor histidine kinase [Ramlibacter sp.]|uniref:sensor histidine kinase n=1 Tax=Ramlibacter sp. TaxID=1917967 RepID=UPI002D7E7878|nr:sensor histidine kinase [Ramlibacter sp.]HET8745241.1 sensor histidine kinase [Ramlibacter sp.]
MKTFFFRLSLSQQFMLLSFPILLAGTLFIGRWIGQQVEDSVVHRVGGVTALYVDSFIAPHVQAMARTDDLPESDKAALTSLLNDTALGKRIAGLKIWRPDGLVVYSSAPDQIGKRYEVEDGLVAALRGEISSEISERSDTDSHGQPLPRVIETYTPIRAARQGRVIAVAEFYQHPEAVDREAGVAQRQSWMTFAATMLTIYLALFAVVRRGSETIVRQQRDLSEKVAQLTALNAQNSLLHQRVKRAAERATALNENFLQRLSADLHDGPGQDLGFALMQLKTVQPQCCVNGASNPQCPATSLEPVRVAVQSALDDLRAISADLQLPDIRHLSLPELAARSVRDYETKTGSSVQLECTMPDVPATMRVKITLCRVLQESLANVYRHAQGKNARVRVSGDTETLVIEVKDEGPGFQPGNSRRHGRLGLAGMRERVEVAGGTFTIQSAAGQGTTVRATLPLTTNEEEMHV